MNMYTLYIVNIIMFGAVFLGSGVLGGRKY